MRVLAVDPGPSLSAIVLINTDLPYMVISHSKSPNDEILPHVSASNRIYNADVLVIEKIAHYGMPVGAEVFDTVFWTGRFFQASTIPSVMIPRRDVKLHICGSPRAKDSNIRAALIERFGEPGTKKNPGILYGIHGDCWQALALAITFAENAKKYLPNTVQA